VAFALYLEFLLKGAPRRTRLLLDREHRVIGALLGQPRGANWLDVCDGALSVLQQMEAKLKLSAPSPKEEEEHRCEGGKEPQKCHRLHHSVHHGISFREGQQVRAILSWLFRYAEQWHLLHPLGAHPYGPWLKKDGLHVGHTDGKPIHSANMLFC
jgi:hypothetical protein